MVDCRSGRDHRSGGAVASKLGADAVCRNLLGACDFFQLRLVASAQGPIAGLNSEMNYSIECPLRAGIFISGNSGRQPPSSLNSHRAVLEFHSEGRPALYAETCAYSVDHCSGCFAANARVRLGRCWAYDHQSRGCRKCPRGHAAISKDCLKSHRVAGTGAGSLALRSGKAAERRASPGSFHRS